MTTPPVALGAAASQVMSAFTLAASSDEGRFAVPSSRTPLSPPLADCRVPCPRRPSSPSSCLVAHEHKHKQARRREQPDESLEDLLRAIARRRLALEDLLRGLA